MRANVSRAAIIAMACSALPLLAGCGYDTPWISASGQMLASDRAPSIIASRESRGYPEINLVVRTLNLVTSEVTERQVQLPGLPANPGRILFSPCGETANVIGDDKVLCVYLDPWAESPSPPIRLPGVERCELETRLTGMLRRVGSEAESLFVIRPASGDIRVYDGAFPGYFSAVCATSELAVFSSESNQHGQITITVHDLRTGEALPVTSGMRWGPMTVPDGTGRLTVFAEREYPPATMSSTQNRYTREAIVIRRDATGRVVWEFQVPDPLALRRALSKWDDDWVITTRGADFFIEPIGDTAGRRTFWITTPAVAGQLSVGGWPSVGLIGSQWRYISMAFRRWYRFDGKRVQQLPWNFSPTSPDAGSGQYWLVPGDPPSTKP